MYDTMAQYNTIENGVMALMAKMASRWRKLNGETHLQSLAQWRRSVARLAQWRRGSAGAAANGIA
jgi:hypothetical protein